ncbi:MAG: GspE/PulE family protein [Pseudomonadota bacterium]
MRIDHSAIDQTLEEVLLEQGLLTQDQLAVAKESQKNLGGSLEQVVIDKGFLTEGEILKALAKKMNTSFVSLAQYKPDAEVVQLLPVSLARKYKVIPLFKIEDKVTVATSNPLNVVGLDEVRRALKYNMNAILALESDVERALNEYYRGKGLLDEEASHEVEVVTDEEHPYEDADVEDLEKAASGEEVVALVNNIISQAYHDRASDIHIEPGRNEVKVRFRIDGVLDELSAFNKQAHLSVISRIKILGGMNVAERRVPQDGRVRLRISGEELDLRIATYPTMFGEAAAIRLLNTKQVMTLQELGFAPKDYEIFKELINRPNGILLVTGPTGSGKTTTLYASLLEISSKAQHILSVEDPIEHEIPGVDQQQVNVKAGMTFAASLRAMLRQDPDVIMVGEIRDFETADIAMRAAMTGHFVFSTLHTNTAVGAITRLKNLQIESFLISSTVAGIMAQRLVRKICDRCKKEAEISQDKIKEFGQEVQISKAYHGEGCKYCRNTGYYGRVGIFEIAPVEKEIKEMIEKNASEKEILEKLLSMGYHTLLQDGVDKINQGITTIDEVLRVTR